MSVHRREHEPGILELVVEHPPVNAFTIGDLRELARCLRAAGDSETRAVVVRSEGRGFCAGGDLKEVQGLPGFEGILGQAGGALDVSLAASECAVPVVVAVHGYCVGVGCLLAGTADVLLASTGTSFVLSEIDNGATAGIAQCLGLLPPQRLRAVMLTCEPVRAEELERHGSVYRIVETPDLADASLAVARQIASKSPPVVRRFKQAFNATVGRDALARHYRQELAATYELNLMGEASKRRDDSLARRRGGSLAAADESSSSD